jgi:hypothetical protein
MYTEKGVISEFFQKNEVRLIGRGVHCHLVNPVQHDFTNALSRVKWRNHQMKGVHSLRKGTNDLKKMVTLLVVSAISSHL